MATRAQLSRILQLIPTHRQPAQPVAALVAALGGDEAASNIEAVLTLLDMFGAVQRLADSVRARDQRATYFMQSLALWLTQAGDDDALITSELIRAMEARRVLLAQRTGQPALPTRLQSAAFVLIGCLIGDETHLLCQWDAQAAQYQLIGGRVEPGESAAQAAEREMLEEVGARQTPPLQTGVDFALHLALNAPIMLEDISPTYGALTRYEFHVFHAQVMRPALALGPDDAWIAVRDLLRGQTSDGKRVGNPGVYHEIDSRISGGLAGQAGFLYRV
jgi:8-oxo-dGTP pyrophosphatase MutT (NUDIX family)